MSLVLPWQPPADNNVCFSLVKLVYYIECVKTMSVNREYKRTMQKIKHYLRHENKELSYCETLTHWGQVMHICVSNLDIVCSGNGLFPGRRKAIIWSNNGIC